MTATAAPVMPAVVVPAEKRPQRRDIQGLRALAVGLVVVYHLRPEWLPGGFVGVDVFFVISGFLIIGTLTGELGRTGRIGLKDFYARRIRRLLPAATVVLLATVAATVLLMPFSRWPDVMREILSSAFNVQNWALAVLSGDYGHATANVSPVQHFWSLSVEEQFYLIIPLVLLAGRKIRYAFVTVVLASFAFSVVYSYMQHGEAYFITPTRMWELGLGGLAAIHRIDFGKATRLILGWAGFAAVIVSAFVLTTSMAFPGYIALLPTLGTVTLLTAGATTEPARYETAFLLGRQPLRYIGDISYSLYLWHWPVIVVILDVTGDDKLTNDNVFLAIGLSLLLAALSKHLIEDPFRKRRKFAYTLGATLVAITVTAAMIPGLIAQARLDALKRQSALVDNYPGALALDPVNPKPVPPGVALVPDPAVADKDGPFAEHDSCNSYDITKEPPSDPACSFGDPAAPKLMVLVGDSHAAQYSSALIDFVKKNTTWRLKVMVRNGCPFSATPPHNGAVLLRECSDQNQKELAAILQMKPNLVVTAAMSQASYKKDLKWTWESPQQLVEGYRVLLQQLSAAQIPVAVIREVPRPATPTPRCLQRDRNGCDTERFVALGDNRDPLVEASQGLTGIQTIDLTDSLCTADICPAVVGNVVVYRDNHLTNSYVRTLAPVLTTKLGLREGP
ncbi:peptidoglycan/LPS O-acetylase OafA/YrhL [Kibdelosporangium banguiense]|uniref:Peptidoglycan/LPS O-acetylase OafA/YrhL n=1 Tax=Kibdelosporangium banguiense TaxID=1365924 RepID=A0ABS4T7C9_9PSEU|nr:acyltransferase family protein [Kibdelosporangium banguiense]MBP2320327.1 peptidoglycan/LPS O-acetylase OafA/YrhL [Kibdelosporangium banguiense]